jgi:transcriptional regulator with XRE-family HTH domain
MGSGQVSAKTRGLGAELKELRNKVGLNTRDAARKIGVSPATLNRIELGTRAASPEEVFGLLVVYEVPVLEREQVLEMAREAAMPVWWDAGKRSAMTRHLSALMNFESEATAITSIELSYIPGLLQTSDYTRAIMACFGKSGTETETRVGLRAGRQTVLSRPRPPRFLAIVDEAAFQRPLGGPAVMAGQIRHILQMIGRFNVTVQVIPFSHGAHRGMVSSFKLIEFDKAPALVFLEHIDYTVFLDKHAHVMPFQRAVEPIVQCALGPAESAEFMASIAAEYERE